MKNLNQQATFRSSFLMLITIGLLISCSGSSPSSDKNKQTTDPLPSWKDGDIKSSIIDYVESVTDSENPDFIPVTDRIATFDNDGTLWSEQPMYFQLFFAIDRVKDMAPDHPEWKTQQPFKAILENNMEEFAHQGIDALYDLIYTTHAGNTSEEFEKIVSDWVRTAKHPTKDKLYTELVFQPMLELIDYLKANDFKVFIVSGGGLDFMRAWTEEIYGIPKEQVVGTTVKTEYEFINDKPAIKRLSELEFLNDKEGKPLSIHKYIGRKPVFAVGNSDGDLQMLRWTDANDFRSFQLYVHHTDSVREWAYDRNSHIGTFNKGLDEAMEKDWAITDMEKDWKIIYPFEKE